MKRYLLAPLIVISFSIIIVAFLIGWFTRQKEMAVNDEIQFIGFFDSVIDVLFTRDSIVILNNEKLHIYQNDGKFIRQIVSPEGDFTIGLSDGRIIFCQWENFIISSPEQIATSLNFYDENRKLLDQHSSNKTIRPTNCHLDKLNTTDHYHGSPNRVYEWDLKSEEITEKHNPKDVQGIKISGTEMTTIVIDKKARIEIPIANIFSAAYANSRQDIIILVDDYGGVWLYRRNNLPKSQNRP